LLAALLLSVVSSAAVAPQTASAQAAAPKPAPRAVAPTGGVTDDVRCLLSMYALAQNKDRQQAAQSGAYFFLGRINARAPGLDLASAIKAQAPTLAPAQIQDELKRCGPMVSASAQSFQSALNSLRPPAPPAAAPAAPGAAAAPPPTTITPPK
jgi:hypothetical protein